MFPCIPNMLKLQLISLRIVGNLVGGLRIIEGWVNIVTAAYYDCLQTLEVSTSLYMDSRGNTSRHSNGKRQKDP